MMQPPTLRKAFTLSALTLIALLFPASMIRMWGQDGREPIPIRTPKPEHDWLQGELRPVASADDGAGPKAEVVVEPPDVTPLPPKPNDAAEVQPDEVAAVDDLDSLTSTVVVEPADFGPPPPPPLPLPPPAEAEAELLKKLRETHPPLKLGADPLPRMDELSKLANEYDQGTPERWAVLLLKELDAVQAGRIPLAIGLTEQRRKEFSFDSHNWVNKYLTEHLNRAEFQDLRNHQRAISGEDVPIVAALYWEAVAVIENHPEHHAIVRDALPLLMRIDLHKAPRREAFYELLLKAVIRLQEIAGEVVAADFLIQNAFDYAKRSAIAIPDKVAESLKERQQMGPQLAADHKKRALKRELEAAYEEAILALRDHPADPKLNHRAGLFECLVLGKWQQGLARLQKANRFAPHMDLFQSEFDLDSANGLSLMELADSWADFAARDKTGLYAEQAKRRACEHYRRAATLLQDPIDKALAAKRAKDCCEDKAPVPKPVPRPVPKPASDPIVGTWDWLGPRGNKLVITFKADGTAEPRTDINWKFDGVAPLGRRYKVWWGNFKSEDTMILKLGRMEGINSQGAPIRAFKRH